MVHAQQIFALTTIASALELKVAILKDKEADRTHTYQK